MPQVWIVKEKSRGQQKSSFARDAALLMVGALMSILAAICTSYFSNKEEKSRTVRQEVLQFNDQLAYDLGKRYNITMALFRNKYLADTPGVKRMQDSLVRVKADWNMKIFAYRAKLNYYYDRTLENEYGLEIYNPIVKLGDIGVMPDIVKDSHLAEIRKLDTIRIKIASLLEKMYTRSLNK